MTAAAASQALTDNQREAGLAELAGIGAWMTHAVLMADLAALAHPSLDSKRRAYFFADYCEASENAVALRAGVAEWTEFWDAGEFRGCADPHERALELLGDRAREAMFALVHGETER